FLEPDFELHVELQRLRRLRAIDDVAHHARAFVEFDDRDRVRRGEAGRRRAVVDDIAIERALAAGLEHSDLARGAGGAERARREIDIGAGIATLQAQFAGLRSIPEMLRFRRGFWFRARGLRHIGYSPWAYGRPPACCGLDATLTDLRQRSRQRCCRMAAFPARDSACMPARHRR